MHSHKQQRFKNGEDDRVRVFFKDVDLKIVFEPSRVEPRQSGFSFVNSFLCYVFCVCVRCARSFNRAFSFFFFFVVSSSWFWKETRYRFSFYSLFGLICSLSLSSCLTVFIIVLSVRFTLSCCCLRCWCCSFSFYFFGCFLFVAGCRCSCDVFQLFLCFVN